MKIEVEDLRRKIVFKTEDICIVEMHQDSVNVTVVLNNGSARKLEFANQSEAAKNYGFLVKNIE